MPRSVLSTTLLLLCATACRAVDPDATTMATESATGTGRCVVEETGGPRAYGRAVYDATRAHSARGARALGTHAVLITCANPDAAGTDLTLLLPNLRDSVPPVGSYAVRIPGVETDTSEWVAWVLADRFPGRAWRYGGVGGSVRITRSARGWLVGGYYVAMSSASRGRDGARHQTVLGGAFAAPRNRIVPEPR